MPLNLINSKRLLQLNRGTDYMDLDKAIICRSSIRKFQSRVVPRDLIEQSLQAAIYAPFAKNGQQ